jgi:antirestriction protein ArdC
MDIYLEITGRIIDQLEKGNIPWRRPWTAQLDWPKNFSTGKEYSGLNTILMSISGFTSPYWLGFKQCEQLGGKIIKGSKATKIIKWNIVRLDAERNHIRFDQKRKQHKAVNKDGKLLYWLPDHDLHLTHKFMRPMCLNVFNAEQITGIDFPQPKTRQINTMEAAEKIIDNMPQKPPITFAGARAAYRPGLDSVIMPPRNSFKTTEGYYSTLFHELIHSTGHNSRLNRKTITSANQGFGSADYAKEELVAELGASFLCGKVAIEEYVIENASAYIANWLKALKDDKRLIVNAAAQAEKAAKFITNEQ